MTHDPAAAENPLGRPSRVLVFEHAAGGGALAGALGAAGCDAVAAGSPSELDAALGRGAWDAVVLDLRAAGAAVQVAGAAGAALSRAGEDAADSKPLVAAIVAAPSGAASRPRDAEIAGLRIDLVLEASMASDTALVVKAVAGALAAEKLVRALEENERLRDTVLFARQTAHDLAQPLTTIIARAQLLRLKLKPDDPNARAVGIICDEADRLAGMVEEFQKLKIMSRPAGTAKA